MAQGNKAFAPSLHGLLAELEAATRRPESALALIDQGLEIARETGEHLMDPYLYRLRGEILLRRGPDGYQSTGRALDAHAVLAPALEGFSPTPELPEIAEARALMGPDESHAS
jgi:hypothetical protein